MLAHWQKGPSMGCPGVSKCPSAVHRGRTIWKGYAAVRIWWANVNKWIPAVLELTECLEEQLRGRSLLGEMWHLTRMANKKKMSQVHGVYYATREERELKQTFDVIPVVQRLYHSTEIEFGVPNPMPKKITVAEVNCEGPRIAEEEIPHLAGVPTQAQREALRKLTGRPATAALNGMRPTAEQVEAHQKMSARVAEQLRRFRESGNVPSTNGHFEKESK
jgi:hypothetical protein